MPQLSQSKLLVGDGANIAPHGFARVATAVPVLHLAEPLANARRVVEMLGEADHWGVEVVVFPELCLTGYTCGDLFSHAVLLESAWQGLDLIRRATLEIYSGLVVVGLPVRFGGRLYNCAAVLAHGEILGLVPKSYLPNHAEFYELRHFSPGIGLRGGFLRENDRKIPLGVDLLFPHRRQDGLVVGVEICEDLWVPNPPSSGQALAGATVLLNLSASNELVGKPAYRNLLVRSQSGRCHAAYLYASSGVGESSSDLVFGGHTLIAENGELLAEGQRFCHQNQLQAADVDLQRLQSDRLRSNTFQQAPPESAATTWRRIEWGSIHRNAPARLPLVRHLEAHPFVPANAATRDDRCEEIFSIQVEGLSRRLRQISSGAVVLGVSGGLDSTLALLVGVAAFDRLGLPRSQFLGLSMPGFGTTNRTRENATALMRLLKVRAEVTDIRSLTLEHLRAQGHHPFGLDLANKGVEVIQMELANLPAHQRNDLVFENTQARIRTSLLMNHGFVLGTGDLSELALGWCTYNADHMSMYAVNASVPKTLVRHLVEWIANHRQEGEVRERLLDVVATPISAELLPTGPDGEATQATEAQIGPYELHDFFLYHLLRYGAKPERIRWLACQAGFSRPYSDDAITQALHRFLHRFFSQQYKRNCLPDGPKVGTISLSPRGDWRMPPDAHSTTWLAWLQSQNATSAPPESAETSIIG